MKPHFSCSRSRMNGCQECFRAKDVERSSEIVDKRR